MTDITLDAVNDLIDQIEARLKTASPEAREYARNELAHIVGVMDMREWIRSMNATTGETS